MKNSLLILILVVTLANLSAQTPSSCTIPDILANEYERDIKTLAMRRMYQLQSPDTALISIPNNWTDTIVEGLAAIFNATSIPERDSVFNMYCVKAQSPDPSISYTPQYQSYNDIIVRVDTNYSWTQAWQNLNPVSGNVFIDDLLSEYEFSISHFYYWAIGDYAILHSDSLWNIYAMIDNLIQDPALTFGEPNGLIGLDGSINYTKIGDDRYYDFSFQWNDCFDGCDNQHTWHFKVNSDCSVDYLGFTDWGIFQILPLPEPISCNLFTSVIEKDTEEMHYIIFPNPADDIVTIQTTYNLVGSTYTIIDQMGRQVLTGDLNTQTTTVDISQMAAGFYLLQVGQQERQTLKLIKR